MLSLRSALLALVVTGGLLVGCSTQSASPPAEAESASYLFALSGQQGTIDGIGQDTGNEELTLTLTGVNDHATQFADRPIRKAYVLSTADLVDRWDGWFADSPPNAVLTFTEPGDPMPHSIVVELTDPVYEQAADTLAFTARHLHRQPDLSPHAVHQVALPRRVAPATFTSATLFIDSAAESNAPNSVPVLIGASAGEDPEQALAWANSAWSTSLGRVMFEDWLARGELAGANLAGVDLAGTNLRNANLRSANLVGANLAGADLSGAYAIGANLDGANLDGANLSGAWLEYTRLEGAHLEGANLDHAALKRAYLYEAALTGANLTGAYLEYANLTGANLSGANLTGADLSGVNAYGANLSGATWTDGRRCAEGSRGDCR